MNWKGVVSEKSNSANLCAYPTAGRNTSIKELCELYTVSRSGYYKWLSRNGQPNRYENTQRQLDEYVKDIHAHYPSMGYRQIWDALHLQTGWKVYDMSVWRSMRRLHLHGYIRKRRYPSRPGNEHEIHPNLLNRQFHASKPLQKVTSDITYIKYGGRWFYLVCYLDLFNNEIFTIYSSSNQQKDSLKKRSVPVPPSFCTAIRLFSIRPQAIGPYLERTTSFKACQEPERPGTML